MFLHSSAYQTVVPQDLFNAFDEFASGALPPSRTLSQILGPWTEQSGYPVLRVVLRDNDAVITQVKTNHFLNRNHSKRLKFRIKRLVNRYFLIIVYSNMFTLCNAWNAYCARKVN